MTHPPNTSIEDVVYYYETIIASMPGNVYWFDVNLRAQGCNQNVLDMLGLNHLQEFKGLSFEEMGEIAGWPAAATEAFKTASMTVINTGKAKLNIEEPPIQHTNGQWLTFLTHRVPIFTQDKKVNGMIGISLDITRRKQLEQALKKANQAKDDFIRNMSHDIRTPLAGIIGMSALLEEELQDGEEKNHAHMVSVSSQQLLTLLNSVLDIVATGRQSEAEVIVQSFNLKTMIEHLVALEMPTVQAKQLKLKVDLDDDLPEQFYSDEVKIQRLLLNLLGNAVKFTEQGEIELGARYENGALCLWVRDTGCGIKEHDQTRIFEKFFRATNRDTSVYNGHGVGLHIVEHYVKLLKGSIKVTSKWQIGTTITVCLPMNVVSANLCITSSAAPTLTANTSSELLATPLSSKKNHTAGVLFVEDNNVALTIAKKYLTQHRLRFKTAQTIDEAYALLQQHSFALVITDIGLPDGTGYELAALCRAFEYNKARSVTPIIGLTARTLTAAEQQHATQAGMKALFNKPLTVRLLEQLMEDFHLPLVSIEVDMPALPLIDESQLKNMAPEDSWPELFDLFQTECHADIVALTAAWQAQDMSALKHLAHKMKSTALYSGAQAMQAACQHLEKALQQQTDATELEPHYQHCQVTVQATLDKIKEFLA
tara:strand:- start:175 stop:2133 length:1959 start_codon:yes stop_codon:yes gene_type:complete